MKVYIVRMKDQSLPCELQLLMASEETADCLALAVFETRDHAVMWISGGGAYPDWQEDYTIEETYLILRG